LEVAAGPGVPALFERDDVVYVCGYLTAGAEGLCYQDCTAGVLPLGRGVDADACTFDGALVVPGVGGASAPIRCGFGAGRV